MEKRDEQREIERITERKKNMDKKKRHSDIVGNIYMNGRGEVVCRIRGRSRKREW